MRRRSITLTTISESSIKAKSDSRMPKKNIGERSGQELTLKPVKEERQFNLEIPLLLAAVILLFIEIFYIKVRGDL